MRTGLSLSGLPAGPPAPSCKSERAEETSITRPASALLYSHSCRRSGRSAALPYPPHEQTYCSMCGGGRFFVIKMGDFLM